MLSGFHDRRKARPGEPAPTERGGARRAASEESFDFVVENIRDYAVFTLDERGFVRTWNEGARRMKGYAANEIVGKHFSTFYPEDDVKAGKCEMELRVAATWQGPQCFSTVARSAGNVTGFSR